ncbi:hypothetical protein [Halocatena salina]|uniref:Uncharacterized protein n=1 Tax=Halocatena salina TaxID=2934340 RepID=A0A8U0A0P4_9EURY|nr:hypothetical protein [Halocatena salina]UPM41653.1 hypothetical protein MW046_06530 [Halocatena salina]
MTDRILTRRKLLGTTSVALFGGVSGCGSILENINATAPESESNSDPSTDMGPQSTPEPPAVSEPTTTEATVVSQSTDGSESTSKGDAAERTPGDSWTPPETPHKPTEDKRDGRINDVDIINKEEASGGGYSNFDLQVGANTWLKDVDPEPEVDGDPYFAVEINGTLVARTDLVPFRKQGSFKVPIDQGGLQQFGAGTLEIHILMLDIDKQTDDLYGEWTGTIEYQPA